MRLLLQVSMKKELFLLLVVHIVIVMSGFSGSTSRRMPWKRTMPQIISVNDNGAEKETYLDLDQSGKISVEDAAKFLCYDISKAAIFIQDNFDLDGDGYLSREELVASNQK